jgi:hypothetical protein
LGSGIRKKPIPDPGSRGQKGTGSRIRNTVFKEIFHGRWGFMLKETREKKYRREMGALASNE